MDVTRRTLTRLVAAAVATPLMEAAPQAPPAESDDDRSAHDLLRSNAQQLAKVSVPMATEPAFRFKA
ncbi:MAG TPA: hypothetical protein VKR43_15910 [Bryobacteraceae bacterium]|nr:hypothetical protein [Bryobacteraceae bacterium]